MEDPRIIQRLSEWFKAQRYIRQMESKKKSLTVDELDALTVIEIIRELGYDIVRR